MKSFVIIFVLIVSSECGLLDDVLSSKDQKSKSVPESNRTEYRQGVLIKVRQTLENGTKIVIDALGNIIKIHPDGKEEITDSKGTPESPKNSSVKDNEIVGKDEGNKPADPKAELPTKSPAEKVKIEAPKTDENQNKTLPTETNGKTKDASNVKNTTDAAKIDGSTVPKNCTDTDDKACGNIKPANRTFLNGDECPKGKIRADDGTCVEEI